jgi:hypothetical protein
MTQTEPHQASKCTTGYDFLQTIHARSGTAIDICFRSQGLSDDRSRWRYSVHLHWKDPLDQVHTNYGICQLQVARNERQVDGDLEFVERAAKVVGAVVDRYGIPPITRGETIISGRWTVNF